MSNWTKDRLAEILETTSNQIPDVWTTRPDFYHMAPKTATGGNVDSS
jgi:hypothetical protein